MSKWKQITTINTFSYKTIYIYIFLILAFLLIFLCIDISLFFSLVQGKVSSVSGLYDFNRINLNTGG